jgi:hypothetical protein
MKNFIEPVSLAMGEAIVRGMAISPLWILRGICGVPIADGLGRCRMDIIPEQVLLRIWIMMMIRAKEKQT